MTHLKHSAPSSNLVLAGTDAGDEVKVRAFLRRFVCIGIDGAVAEQAVVLRQTRRIKLPDAIIRATAMNESALLVTRNTKDFPADSPDIRVPYVVYCTASRVRANAKEEHSRQDAKLAKNFLCALASLREIFLTFFAW